MTTEVMINFIAVLLSPIRTRRRPQSCGVSLGRPPRPRRIAEKPQKMGEFGLTEVAPPLQLYADIGLAFEAERR
jgi:hypothetical protein